MVGVVLTALSVTISAVGISWAGSLYWAGILFAICGVAGAAIREAKHFGIRYSSGVISAMVGVLVIGYGVESGTLLIMLVGVVILVVGALGVIFDTQPFPNSGDFFD
jgi:hypothetical protein